MVQTTLNELKRAIIMRDAKIARLRDALDGCLHFDDGFIKDSRIGEELRKWRAEARSILGMDTT